MTSTGNCLRFKLPPQTLGCQLPAATLQPVPAGGAYVGLACAKPPVTRMVRAAAGAPALLRWPRRAKAHSCAAHIAGSAFRTLTVGLLGLLVTMPLPVVSPGWATAAPGPVPTLRSGALHAQPAAYNVVCIVSPTGDGCVALARALAGVAVVSHAAAAVAHRWAARMGAALVEDANLGPAGAGCNAWRSSPLVFRIIMGSHASELEVGGDGGHTHVELPAALGCESFKKSLAAAPSINRQRADDTASESLEQHFIAQLLQLRPRQRQAAGPHPLRQHSAVPLMLGSSRTVALVASELSPVTAGGAGVVAAALAVELASRGTRVVVIATIPCADARTWEPVAQRAVTQRAHDSGHQAPASIVALCAEELVAPFVTPGVRCHSHPAMHASIIAAFAVQEAFRLHAFDAVEFFDFNGPAFELLRDRVDHLHPLATAPTPLYPCVRRDANLAVASTTHLPYIPPSVAVLVRTHGTIHAIDHDEAAAAGSGRGAVKPDLRYALEQYALQAASVVIAQTSWVAEAYSRWYSLQPARVAISAPPMEAVMALQRVPTAEKMQCPIITVDASKGPVLLVYGKLQAIKAPELVAAAFANVAASELAANRSVRLLFLGRDVHCSQHAWQAMKTCILQRLPAGQHGLVSFLPAVPGRCLQSTLAAVRPLAAVFASSFETFNLAAHEVAASGVPVVVSTAVALDHFTPTNAYIFETGDQAALTAAMKSVLHAAPGSRKVPAVTYGRDPVAVYHNESLLALQPPVLAPRTRRLVAKWVWDEL